jgi:hypothetical protein
MAVEKGMCVCVGGGGYKKEYDISERSLPSSLTLSHMKVFGIRFPVLYNNINRKYAYLLLTLLGCYVQGSVKILNYEAKT